MLEIKSGHRAVDVIQRIYDHRTEIRNKQYSSPWDVSQENFVKLIEAVEVTMESCFEGGVWEEDLRNPLYWHVLEIDRSSLRPLPQISSAFKRLDRWLPVIENDLKRVAKQEDDIISDATRLVLDSSAVLRGICFSQIDWTEELNVKEVKIFLPILVIRELDNLKNSGREPKARLRLKKIREVLGDTGIGPAPVLKGVTLQLLMDPARHVRLPISDQEITDRARYLSGRPGGPLILMTGDFTQEFLARAEGLDARALPEKMILPSLNDQ